MEHPNKTKEAFNWIVNILKARGVPLAITGGLAAKIYGATRPLNDIDIDIPDDKIDVIYQDVRDYVVDGPIQMTGEGDDWWKGKLLTLNYQGQLIDITGADTLKVRDSINNVYVSCGTDFSKAVEQEIFGLKVPVVSREELIAYKKLLAVGWLNQKRDVEELEKS